MKLGFISCSQPIEFAHLSSERYNVNVHRAAAKIIVSKSRAAHGSVCNVLLSRVWRPFVKHDFRIIPDVNRLCKNTVIPQLS